MDKSQTDNWPLFHLLGHPFGKFISTRNIIPFYLSFINCEESLWLFSILNYEYFLYSFPEISDIRVIYWLIHQWAMDIISRSSLPFVWGRQLESWQGMTYIFLLLFFICLWIFLELFSFWWRCNIYCPLEIYYWFFLSTQWIYNWSLSTRSWCTWCGNSRRVIMPQYWKIHISSLPPQWQKS